MSRVEPSFCDDDSLHKKSDLNTSTESTTVGLSGDESTMPALQHHPGEYGSAQEADLPQLQRPGCPTRHPDWPAQDPDCP